MGSEMCIRDRSSPRYESVRSTDESSCELLPESGRLGLSFDFGKTSRLRWSSDERQMRQTTRNYRSETTNMETRNPTFSVVNASPVRGHRKLIRFRRFSAFSTGESVDTISASRKACAGLNVANRNADIEQVPITAGDSDGQTNPQSQKSQPRQTPRQ